ncbi:MAG: ABC transporter permease [bacterium]
MITSPSEGEVRAFVREVAAERFKPEGLLDQLAARPNLIRVLSVVLFLTLWEIVAAGIDPILFAGPIAIAKSFYRLTASGELPREMGVSLGIFLIGLTLATVVGISVGLAMGRHRMVEYVIDPYINALYATPRIALIPLLILWLGLDAEMKIFVVFLVGFFPICINTAQGVKNVSGHYVEVARAYGATERQIFTKVIVPSAIPFIMTGFRLGVGRSLVGMVVAELLGTLSGMGAMIDKYSSEFETDSLFVPIIMLAFLGITVTEAVKRLEIRFSRWKETEGAQE